MSKVWETESWKESTGITQQAKLGTNSALAERDYSVVCNTGIESTHLIALVNGIWLWWCSTHYQPLTYCNLGKSEVELRRVKTAVIGAVKDAA